MIRIIGYDINCNMILFPDPVPQVIYHERNYCAYEYIKNAMITPVLLDRLDYPGIITSEENEWIGITYRGTREDIANYFVKYISDTASDQSAFVFRIDGEFANLDMYWKKCKTPVMHYISAMHFITFTLYSQAYGYVVQAVAGQNIRELARQLLKYDISYKLQQGKCTMPIDCHS